MAHASGTTPKVRIVKSGEIVAIKPDALRGGEQNGRRAIWWDLGVQVKPNEQIDDVVVVHVRGSLEHHPYYASDSYDQIRERVREACGRDDSRVIVLRLDSPGGVVSGLNELVRDLRALSVEFDKPLVAFVDEMAASAAYAIACACDEIYLPRSAICGSVGVISTLHDQVAADKDRGLNFVTITSGARKADGHPHVPISDDAIASEKSRVDRLARQFYKLVAEVRPLSTKEIAGLEAGIFVGREAVVAGLADDVMGWGDLLDALKGLDMAGTRASGSTAQDGTPAAKGNETDRKATPPHRSESVMLVSLKAQVKRAKSELAKAKGDALKRALKAQIDALEKAIAASAATVQAKKKIKHKEVTHEEETDDGSDDEGDEDAGDEDESDDEEESKKAKKSKHADSDDDGDGDGDDGDGDSDGGDDSEEEDEESEEESEEEEKYGEEDEKKSAKAIVALAQKATGKKGRSALGALTAILADAQRSSLRLAKIERERLTERKSALIDSAKAQRRITPHEAKVLRKKPLSFVASFLEMRPKALFATDEGDLIIPKTDKTGNAAGLPADVTAEIEKAIASANVSPERAEKLRKEMTDAHAQRIQSTTNGAGMRY